MGAGLALLMFVFPRGTFDRIFETVLLLGLVIIFLLGVGLGLLTLGLLILGLVLLGLLPLGLLFRIPLSLIAFAAAEAAESALFAEEIKINIEKITLNDIFVKIYQ